MRFYSSLSRSIRCQRGIALPMAMLTLLILSALMIGFSLMAASEPVLANNQLQVGQARAVAESGIERAVWALNNPSAANGIRIRRCDIRWAPLPPRRPMTAASRRPSS